MLTDCFVLGGSLTTSAEFGDLLTKTWETSSIFRCELILLHRGGGEISKSDMSLKKQIVKTLRSISRLRVSANFIEKRKFQNRNFPASKKPLQNAITYRVFLMMIDSHWLNFVWDFLVLNILIGLGILTFFDAFWSFLILLVSMI